MMFGMALIPIAISIVVIVWSIVAITNEVRLAKRVLRDSLCMRCKHAVTQDMLASGRCPECGTPYVFGGIESPSLRLERHIKLSSSVAVVIVLSGIASIFVGQLVDVRWISLEEWVPMVVGLGAWVVLIALGVVIIKLRRRRILRKINAMEQAWNDDRRAGNLPRLHTSEVGLPSGAMPGASDSPPSDAAQP